MGRGAWDQGDSQKCWGAGPLWEILLQASTEAVSVTQIPGDPMTDLVSQDNLISFLQFETVRAELRLRRLQRPGGAWTTDRGQVPAALPEATREPRLSSWGLLASG